MVVVVVEIGVCLGGGWAEQQCFVNQELQSHTPAWEWGWAQAGTRGRREGRIEGKEEWQSWGEAGVLSQRGTLTQVWLTVAK